LRCPKTSEESVRYGRRSRSGISGHFCVSSGMVHEEVVVVIGKTFLNSIANGETDIVRLLLSLLEESGSMYCVIGGLGVNAYAEPVVSLDLDLVVVLDHIPRIRSAAEAKGMKVEEFEHSVNLSISGSDLRIQLQTDPRYQNFLAHAELHDVLGYTMSVASLADVLTGKIWAYSDETRRKSKRQKDLADIMRLVEGHPDLKDKLPADIAAQLES